MAHKNGIVWEQARFKVAFFRGKIKIVWDTLEVASPKEGSKNQQPAIWKRTMGTGGGPLQERCETALVEKVDFF